MSGPDHPQRVATGRRVLVVANDFSLAAAKTSRYIGLALRRLGHAAIVRDTRLVRWAAGEVERASEARRQAYESDVVGKWQKFVFAYGINTVVSLDLNWLVSGRLFLADERVEEIHSVWFDDLRSHFQGAAMFRLEPQSPLEVINTAKITHHTYGMGQAEEMRLLGVRRIRPSALAAPEEYLRAEDPCAVRDRLGFVGNPGLPTPPEPAALAALKRGEGLEALRRLARQEVLDELPAGESTAGWLKQEPGVRDLLATVMESRLTQPHTAAITLLLKGGRAFPAAFEFLNRNGFILDAALLVKMVNRYDRPALVHRLWKRGWLDVHGMPEQWEPFGVEARPTVTFPRLASVYRRYPAHLNAANCARDASANEKLFEMAACGRASLNLDSPDVRACYSDEEIALAPDLQALEAAAEQILRDPDAALAQGERARVRTAREHLWEHRLERALA